MPQRKCAEKELRKNLRRRKRNLAVKKRIKDAIKKFKRALQRKEISPAQEALNLVYKTLDKAAAKRVIHPNKAARKKSRLTLLMKKQLRFQEVNQKELNS